MTHPLPLSEDLWVKPLEWTTKVDDDGIMFRASALDRDYLTWHEPDEGWVSPLMNGGRFETLELAKSAAQADYAKHIISALSDLALTALRANSGEVTEAEVDAAWNAMLLSCARSDTVSRKGMRPALEAAARIRSQHQEADQ